MLRQQHVDLKRMFSDIRASTTYLTHGFDSYPAKMIPHMARFLIKEISKPGETILDPFCGSGAVLLESVLNGRNALGVDSNSMAIALAMAKTTLYDTALLKHQLREIMKRVSRCKESFDF